jgi:hypothetical protein
LTAAPRVDGGARRGSESVAGAGAAGGAPAATTRAAELPRANDRNRREDMMSETGSESESEATWKVKIATRCDLKTKSDNTVI